MCIWVGSGGPYCCFRYFVLMVSSKCGFRCLLARVTNSPMYIPSVIIVCYLRVCAILDRKFLQSTVPYHIIQLLWIFWNVVSLFQRKFLMDRLFWFLDLALKYRWCLQVLFEFGLIFGSSCDACTCCFFLNSVPDIVF